MSDKLLTFSKYCDKFTSVPSKTQVIRPKITTSIPDKQTDAQICLVDIYVITSLTALGR